MATLLQQEDLGPRGTVRCMRARITVADAATAGTFEYDFPELPAGTILRAVQYLVASGSEFDSGTSDGLELGDGTDADEYCASVDVQTAANATMVTGSEDDAPPHQLEAATTLRLTLTSAGTAATAGSVDVTVTYELCNV